jgi:hypothetical protein
MIGLLAGCDRIGWRKNPTPYNRIQAKEWPAANSPFKEP